MSTALDRGDSRLPSTPVLIGLALSVVLLAVAALLGTAYHSRNDDLSAVGTFFSAVSASIATVWLVVAVFVQSAELRLQRKELEAQREQTRLLTEEARVQAQSQSASLALQTKRDLYAQVVSIVDSNADEIRDIARCLQDKAFEHVDPASTEIIERRARGYVNFSRKCAAVTLFRDDGNSHHEVPWDVVMDRSVASSGPWDAIISCAAEAAMADVGIWWRDNLAMSVPAHGRLPANEVSAALLAAIYSVDRRLQVVD